MTTAPWAQAANLPPRSPSSFFGGPHGTQPRSGGAFSCERPPCAVQPTVRRGVESVGLLTHSSRLERRQARCKQDCDPLSPAPDGAFCVLCAVSDIEPTARLGVSVEGLPPHRPTRMTDRLTPAPLAGFFLRSLLRAVKPTAQLPR